jgi:RND family efflux transporter MFP subunit
MSDEITATRDAAIDHAPPRWRWKIGAVLALGVIGFWLVHARGTRASATTDASADTNSAVAAVKVERHDLSLQQTFEAEFRPFQEIEVYSKVSGFLQNISVDVGDRVEAGQVIANVEVPELKDDLAHAVAVQQRSEAEVKRAESDHEDAHLSYTRTMSADKAQPNLIAQQDVDRVRAKDEEAEAALSAAKDQVAVAIADVKKLNTMLSFCKITAPFGGVITKRSIDPGALVHGASSTSPLVRLSQNDRLRLVFPVSVSYVPLIKEGDRVEIQVASLQTNFSGSISRFTRRIDTATRTMEVEADVPNTDLKLIPGMYAAVSLTTQERKNALSLPIEAISRQKTSTVFLVNSKAEIEERTVTTGLETPSEMEIVSGLEEGDTVMIGSRSQVHLGQKVTAKLLVANVEQKEK